MKPVQYLLAALVLITGLQLNADPPTPAPAPSQTSSSINVDVDKKTDKVNYKITNNDGKVITKTYILKHADPYEIRGFLQSAVGARRITGAPTGVECIKYNDGTGAVIVSAEAYRFKKQPNGGMSIDELVAELDKPDIKENPNDRVQTIHAPQGQSAEELARKLRNVGITRPNDPAELDGGNSKVLVDPGLNVIIVDTPPFDAKNAKKMIQVLDGPIPQANISYRLYEMTDSQAEKFGNDYQAWKNGPGSELFAAGAQVTNNSRTHFIKFSPRWDSRYFDYLHTEKKIKQVLGGSAIIQNRTQHAFDSALGNTENAAAATTFNLRIRPFITDVSTLLDIQLTSRPIDGTPYALSTRATVKNGDSVVIGGMTRTSAVTSESGGGFMESIPLIGGLFASEDTSEQKTQMIVVIKCVLDK